MWVCNARESGWLDFNPLRWAMARVYAGTRVLPWSSATKGTIGDHQQGRLSTLGLVSYWCGKTRRSIHQRAGLVTRPWFSQFFTSQFRCCWIKEQRSYVISGSSSAVCICLSFPMGYTNHRWKKPGDGTGWDLGLVFKKKISRAVYLTRVIIKTKIMIVIWVIWFLK